MMNHRTLLWAAVGLTVFLAWSWLAGLFFCVLGRMSIHQATPWMLWRYLPYYFGVKSVKFLMNLSSALSSVTLGLLIGVIVRSRRREAPYGDAHWAGGRDIRNAGLFDQSGIILGKRNGRLICVPGWEHVMCFAPSGSGKGVGIVIPNLLHWADSAIVHDVKGENYRLTSGFRAACGQKVYFFNPGDPKGRTHRYNPFQFISKNPGLRIDDVQKIAHLILPKHEFWENEARTLLVGLALHLLDDVNVPVTFGNILCRIRETNFYDYVADLLTRHRDEMNPVACLALNAFHQKAEKEKSGVLSTLNSALELWANPLIDAATSASDFDLRRFKKERITLYVGVSPNNLFRLQPLLQILYQQATDILTEKEPDPVTEPHGVLFLMDEFASLGRMTQFEQASAYFRGYRVRFMMIIQDLPQLERHYERAGLYSFLGMCKIKVTFAQGDYQTAEVISNFLGTYGAKTKSISEPIDLPWSGGRKSRTTSETSRALLLPQEILQLPPDEEIILVEGAPPIRARKLRYFEESRFKDRIRPPVALTAIEPLIRHLTFEIPPSRELTETEKYMLRTEYGMEDPVEANMDERDGKTPLLPDGAIN
jgi:type IV secretion system protein VirD4